MDDYTIRVGSSSFHEDSVRIPNGMETREKARNVAIRLLSLSEKCRVSKHPLAEDSGTKFSSMLQMQEMSGRSLRRLPVLAHARYIGTMPAVRPRRAEGVNGKAQTSATDVEVWLEAMEKVVDAQGIERSRLRHGM